MIHKRINNRELVVTGIEKAIDWLVIGALLLGMLSLFMEGDYLASLAYVRIEDPWSDVVRSPIFKIVKVLEVVCVLAAGFLAYWAVDRFHINRSIRWALYGVLLWMTGHAFIGFSGGFTPYELLNQKGPIVWWSLFFLFAGFSKARWERIYPVIKCIVIIGSIEMAYRIMSLAGSFDRIAAQRTLRMSLRLMLWSAPLVFLVAHKNVIWKVVSISSFFLVAAASFMTGTRSWLIVCLIYFALIIYSSVKRSKKLETKILIIYLIFASLALAGIVGYFVFEPQIEAGRTVLLNRLTEDTRLGQLTQFFHHVSVVDLLAGTGPRGTWFWGGKDYGYVDGVYFFLLFLGGIPLLGAYLYLVVFPPIRCFFHKRLFQFGSVDFACIGMGMMWALVMTGLGTYTIPELKVHHYIVLLCVGRCWGMLLEASGSLKNM